MICLVYIPNAPPCCENLEAAACKLPHGDHHGGKHCLHQAKQGANPSQQQ